MLQKQLMPRSARCRPASLWHSRGLTHPALLAQVMRGAAVIAGKASVLPIDKVLVPLLY